MAHGSAAGTRIFPDKKIRGMPEIRHIYYGKNVFSVRMAEVLLLIVIVIRQRNHSEMFVNRPAAVQKNENPAACL